MRHIKIEKIKNTISRLCVEANTKLRPDVLSALKAALKKETKPRAKGILRAIIENAVIAKDSGLAICQDTGMPVVFVEIGRDVHIVGGDLSSAVNEAVRAGYKNGCLRNSIVKNPLSRGMPGFAPAIIHTEITSGKKMKLTVLPKGFGCENNGLVKMFKPTAELKAIKEFVVDAVKKAGADACPPFVVGVGIGGTQDYACLLAKKALLRTVTSHQSPVTRLEKELLKEINRLNIGPMGLGGRTTCLGVNLEAYPTHIAGLPVCVNINCHALRSATEVI